MSSSFSLASCCVYERGRKQTIDSTVTTKRKQQNTNNAISDSYDASCRNLSEMVLNVVKFGSVDVPVCVQLFSFVLVRRCRGTVTSRQRALVSTMVTDYTSLTWLLVLGCSAQAMEACAMAAHITSKVWV